MYETTREDFEQFVDEGNYYQNLLNLNDWHFEYIYDEDIEDEDYYAAYAVSYEGRCATVTFPSAWNVAVTSKMIRKVVVHELLHIVLSPLIVLSRDGGIPNMVLTSEEHRVIRVLEKLLEDKT